MYHLLNENKIFLCQLIFKLNLRNKHIHYIYIHINICIYVFEMHSKTARLPISRKPDFGFLWELKLELEAWYEDVAN